jgi:beta-lactam-binding protein with PASTA domain
VMSDAEKTTIIGATPGGYADQWDDDDQAARKRKRNRIIALVVGALVLIGGAIAIALAVSGGDDEPPAVAQVAVPDLVGQTQDQATAAITEANLRVGTVTPQTSTEEQKGTVLSSDPTSGTEVDEQTVVKLVVGSGPNTLAVPNVVGRDQDAARSALESAGFTGSISTDQVDSLEAEGTVVEIDPAVGSQAAPDAAIRLGVSTGTIDLPDVRGLTEAAAREQLVSAGIDNGQITSQNVESDTVAAGNVVNTDPGPRAPVGEGDTITLLIAVPVPSAVPETSTTPAEPTETPSTSPTTSPATG